MHVETGKIVQLMLGLGKSMRAWAGVVLILLSGAALAQDYEREQRWPIRFCPR